MAGEIKISGLTLAGPAQDADIVAGVQSGITVKQTNSALATYVSAKVNLNTAYANTSGQNLNITSGLNINGNNLNFIGSDSSESSYSGAFLNINNPIDQGIFSSWSEIQIRGTSTHTPSQFICYTSYGFNNETTGGAESSFVFWEILSDGIVNGAMALLGADINGGCRLILGGDGTNDFINSVSINLPGGVHGTPDPSALFEMHSTSQAFLPPNMTNSQFTSISLPASGLLGYVTDYNSFRFFDGTDFETILTGGNVLAGSNFTIVDNGNGTFTYSASGGGSLPSASYSSLSIQNNSVATVFAAMNTFYPIYLGASFAGNDSSNFTNQFLSIGGISTPVMTYTGGTTQFFNINIGLTVRGAVAAQTGYVYSIYIRQSGGTIVATQYRGLITLSDLITFLDVPITGNIQLSTGDSVFIEVQNISNTNAMYAAYATYSAISLAGSIPDTDGLPQGTSNLYLSQDGGTTYENVNGSVTASHLTSFFNSNGKIKDSGIGYSGSTISADITGNAGSATNIGVTSTGSNSSFYPVFVGSSSTSNQAAFANSTFNFNPAIGLNALGLLIGPVTSTVSSNTKLQLSGTDSSSSATPAISFFTNVDSYPLMTIYPYTHGTSSLNFDAYYTGSWLSAYSGSNFQIQSLSNSLNFNYSSGNAQGAAITWGTGMSLSNSGVINFPQLTGSQLLAINGSKNLISTNSGTYGISITGTATNANNIAVTQATNSANYFPAFVVSSATGTQNIRVGTGLTFNPSTNVLSTTTFSGTATNATNGTTVSAGSNSTYYPIFAASSINSNQPFNLNTSLNYNPSTTNLTTGGLILSSATAGFTQKSVAVSAGTADGPFNIGVVLVAGTVTISNSYVTTNCVATVAVSATGGTPSLFGYRVIVGAGTYTVTGAALDTSTLNVHFTKGN